MSTLVTPRALVSAALVACLLVAWPGSLPSAAASLDAQESGLVSVVNSFRAERGLARLAVSDTLTFAAKWMATDMAVYNYFSHTSRDGRAPVQRMSDAGYPGRQTYTGENIAGGYSSASEVLSGWINSPAHYAVLTNPNYRAIGVGRAYSDGSSYRTYWVMDVGGLVDAATAVPSFDLGYHAAWAGQSADVTLSPGQTATLVLALRNTGYRGWYRGNPGQQANLGTADPLDAQRWDLQHGWPSASRIATTTTAYVGPGQVGWFQFQVRGPASPGRYVLRVRGVIDGATWLEDPGVYWTITVR
ncbi:MAG TPA: CAP domain-containing protein [Candidatus Limnocylindria bacterium]|nr:CAP domain-containing protein [Candidatus Limnocylindria bacterium]